MRFTFFYGTQVYHETEAWDDMNRTMYSGPDGLWLLDNIGTSVWYLKSSGQQDIENVPVELRMLQLLLNL